MTMFVYYYLEDKTALVTDQLGIYKVDGRRSSQGQIDQAKELGQGLKGYYHARYFRMAEVDEVNKSGSWPVSEPRFVTDFISL